MSAPIDIGGGGADTEIAPPRFEQYEAADKRPPMPAPPLAGAYLVRAMNDLGATRPLAMGGFRAADWPEIWPFMQATGAVSEPWEARALYDMCAAFVRGFETGRSPLGISPMEREGAV